MALFRVGTDSAAATYFDTIAATEGIGKTLLVYKENIADSLTNDGDHFMGQVCSCSIDLILTLNIRITNSGFVHGS